MSSRMQLEFNRESIDTYIKEVAKEFKRKNGNKIKAEIILVGGAAVMLNYDFRQMTTDVDAMYEVSLVMKEAINYVGDKYGLPSGWMNSDFRRTDSYTPRLRLYASYYKTYSDVIKVYTVKAEYLIAMKLISGRVFKNDLSDIVGILMEQDFKGEPVDMESIMNAVNNLYGNWNKVSSDMQSFITERINNRDYTDIYKKIRQQENDNKDMMIEFEDQYPGVVNRSNANDVMLALAKRRRHDD